MKQSLVVLLKKEKNIEKIRRKYVPNYKKYLPHISLVYPFIIKNQEILNKHIKKSIENTEPFKLELKGLRKSTKGYYLYLIPKKGRKELNKLHQKLNGGILKEFKNKDMHKYIPHLTIGVFKTKKEIDEAIKRINIEKLFMKTKITKIQLLSIAKNDRLIKVKNYKLS